jgi:uncharacterized protein (UPF0303 family)
MPTESYTLAELAAQEQRLQFAHFDNDDAIELGTRLVSAARAQNAPVAIDISRSGHVLFHIALPGATPDNDGWIARKSRVVQRFGHSSLFVRTQCEVDGTTLEGTYGLDPQEYAAHGGAFPVIVRGVGPVGIVVVSGLPQLEDHTLVTDVIGAYLAEHQATI